MGTRPTEFTDWLATKPKEFLDRIDAGEAGNKQNPMIAARMAFDAGKRAGLTIAAHRLIEVVFDAKLEFTEFRQSKDTDHVV